jgi:sugar O-acyltransferase (sialic acid O-acetyltransferase NeuD family)
VKKKIFIAGAGELGRELFGWIVTDPGGPPFEVVGFVDDREMDVTTFGIDLPVCRPGEWAKNFQGAFFLTAVISSTGRRSLVAKLFDAGARPTSYIHPSVLIGYRVTIGDGTVISPQSIVSSHASLGSFVLINCACVIGHDTRIGDYATLLGGNTINGVVAIGPDAVIGSRAVIHPKTTIGEGAKVGIGSVVVGNVKPGITVFGNPARKLA